MPDTDPTPETPVTIRDALGWWRGDLDARLDALGTAIATLQGTAPYNTLADLFAKMEEVRASVANLALTNGFLIDIESSLATLHEDLLDLRSDTGSGASGYLATMTTRGLLYQILKQLRANSIGVEPSDTGDAGQYGTIVDGSYRYALFSAPLQNITVSEDGRTLTLAHWAGYSAYIQTSGPYAYIAGSPHSPNTWIDLSGLADDLTFAVDMPNLITVYLKFPLIRTYTWGPTTTDFVAFFNSSNEPRKVALGAKYDLPGDVQAEGWSIMEGNWSGYTVTFSNSGLYGGQVGYGVGSVQYWTDGLSAFTVPQGTTAIVLLFVVWETSQVITLSPPTPP
ncbi:MAG: hypothetical protein HGA65_03430 [Oscillochloris sp.]|nr:hypothetical protein [Oscillochloris sp.]